MEAVAKHAALLAEFEAEGDGVAFIDRVEASAPRWPADVGLREAVAAIGGRKFEDGEGIVREIWSRATKPRVVPKPRGEPEPVPKAEPEVEAGASIRRRLRAELPGIAQRAVAAYRRLKARGAVIQPKAGLALKAEVAAGSDPFAAFFEDWLVIDRAASVKCGKVYEVFQGWCLSTGNLGLLKKVPDASKLTKPLKKLPGLAALQTMKPEGKPREYVGLRLKSKDERESPA